MRDKAANVSITNIAMNRGYFRAIDIQNSKAAIINGNLIFRSHLPALRVMGGSDNVISSNLATVGIFWNTHRGAIQVCYHSVCVCASVCARMRMMCKHLACQQCTCRWIYTCRRISSSFCRCGIVNFTFLGFLDFRARDWTTRSSMQ